MTSKSLAGKLQHQDCKVWQHQDLLKTKTKIPPSEMSWYQDRDTSPAGEEHGYHHCHVVTTFGWAQISRRTILRWKFILSLLGWISRPPKCGCTKIYLRPRLGYLHPRRASTKTRIQHQRPQVHSTSRPWDLETTGLNHFKFWSTLRPGYHKMHLALESGHDLQYLFKMRWWH